MSANHEDVIQHLAVPRYAPRLQPTTIPTAAWNDEPLFCLEVNDEWVSHILGVLIALDQQDTWIGTDEEIWLARQQVNEIMAAFMEGCDMDCCLPPLSRVLGDGTMEVSYDGGVTWSPATTEDPRKAAPSLPPIDDGEGANKRCKAANRVVRQLKDTQNEFKNHLGAGLTVLQLALAFAGAVAVLFLSEGSLAPIIVPALLSLAAAIVGTGATAYDDLFTSDVWSSVICKIYCHTEEDGSYNQSDFLDILSDIDALGLDSTVALTLTSILRGWQLEGLNNAARVITADNLSCADCACPDTCRAKYELFDTYGTIVDSGDDYITVEAIVDVRVGGYAAGISALSPFTDCCAISFDVLSGSISDGNLYFANCGETPNPTSFNHAAGSLGGCLSMATKISTAAFTIRYNFAEDCS